MLVSGNKMDLVETFESFEKIPSSFKNKKKEEKQEIIRKTSF